MTAGMQSRQVSSGHCFFHKTAVSSDLLPGDLDNCGILFRLSREPRHIQMDIRLRSFIDRPNFSTPKSQISSDGIRNARATLFVAEVASLGRIRRPPGGLLKYASWFPKKKIMFRVSVESKNSKIVRDRVGKQRK